MGKEKFVFNKETLEYERVRKNPKRTLFYIASFVLAAGFLGFFSYSFLSSKFPSLDLRQNAAEHELAQMKIKYNEVNKDLTLMQEVLGNIQDRDANVHRMVFGVDPIDQNVWNGGVGGHVSHADLADFKSTPMLKSTLNRADDLMRKLSLQSTSLDELEELVREKEDFVKCVPSIKPVKESSLKRKIKYLSGFGMRIHPIYKIPKMHKGLDFTAPKGTLVQATGDGKVVKVEKKKRGYGLNITIDHGYGYKTLYAHLSEADVKVGQRVKKGEPIGKVGSSGASTAPHLHYEVHYKGKAIDPINFCMDGLSPEEYDEFVKLATKSNKSLD